MVQIANAQLHTLFLEYVYNDNFHHLHWRLHAVYSTINSINVHNFNRTYSLYLYINLQWILAQQRWIWGVEDCSQINSSLFVHVRSCIFICLNEGLSMNVTFGSNENATLCVNQERDVIIVSLQWEEIINIWLPIQACECRKWELKRTAAMYLS